MEKDFDRWNDLKKRVNDRSLQPLYHAREIWWASLGVNVGYEQDGTGASYERPVLILRGPARLSGGAAHHFQEAGPLLHFRGSSGRQTCSCHRLTDPTH